MPDLKSTLDSLKDAAFWAFVSNLLIFGGLFASAYGFFLAATGTAIYFTIAQGKVKRFLADLSTLGYETDNAEKGAGRVFGSFLGITLGLFVVLVATIAGFITGAIHFAVALTIFAYFVVTIMAIVYIIASIPIGVAVNDFGSRVSSDLLRLGGILTIIPVVSIIGWLLVYIEADNVSMKAGVSPQQGQANMQVYPEGNGVLGRDGVAQIVLISNVYAGIVGASLIGFPSVTFVSAVPSQLNLGRNAVRITFSNLPPLKPGLYYITVYLSNGTSVNVPVYYS